MAAIYITLSITAAILFFLTREVDVRIEKRDRLIIKIDLIFFAIHLFKTSNTKDKPKKIKAEDKSGKKISFIYKRIVQLLSKSKIKISRLSLPLFIPEDDEDFSPVFFGNTAIGFVIVAYLKSLAKQVYVSDGACAPVQNSDLVYDLTLTAPLIIILHTVIGIRFDLYKNEKAKRLKYVRIKDE